MLHARAHSDAIIIGAAILAAVLIIAIVVLIVLYRRRGATAHSPSDLELKSLAKDQFELARGRVRLGDKLGNGAFGEVFKGWIRSAADAERECAVKVLKPGAPQKEKLEFLAEIQLMKDLGPHPNIIGIIGHCLKEQPFLLMVELVQHGNLRDYLRSCRPKHGAPPKLTVGDLADFSLQIASGMEFLATRNVVHRDLAARNVLVGKKHSLKISDFGLARSMEEDEYHATGMKLPIKWMAPEAIRYRTFTTKTDVWAFGVTMWETFSLGGTPYPAHRNKEVLKLLESGERLQRSPGTPAELYRIMCLTWHINPDERPTFADLVAALLRAINNGFTQGWWFWRGGTGAVQCGAVERCK